jgi:hypothetical protein
MREEFMPYSTEYVEPEVFCEIDGVSIYYLYRDGDAQSSELKRSK